MRAIDNTISCQVATAAVRHWRWSEAPSVCGADEKGERSGPL